MTYNQVIKRIKEISLAHKQVRTFKKGLITEFLTDKTIPYPAIFLMDNGGAISFDNNRATFNFRIFFLDLVHVSEHTKDNELDVLSDMVSIALDVLAQLNHPGFNDWILSGSNNFQFVVENDGDLNAGIYTDVSVSVMYSQNVCQIPTDFIDYEPPENNADMKVYDQEYVASGNEGTILTTSGTPANIPEINGKKILLITREYTPLYKSSQDYLWNGDEVELKLPTLPNERFLFLYRNY